MKILSRNQEKMIRSLQRKKHRKEHALFAVEGKKMIKEALGSTFEVQCIIVNEELVDDLYKDIEVYVTDKATMKQISSLTTPPGALAVIKQQYKKEENSGDLTLVLDKIQDPGNLGTIIRTADAFGIKEIICSTDTVDCYSPKVVQATMGAIFRVNLSYQNLEEYLVKVREKKSIYAAHLGGNNIYQQELIKPAIILMGNESEGISDNLISLIKEAVKIPIEGAAESFNVSIATAIILSEFKRQFAAF